MASTFTPNIGLEQPSNGSYNDDWDIPVNADWAAIDNVAGGTTGITVTGIPQGVYPLSLTQYRPRNIEFLGTLSGNLVYNLPSGVGGTWSLWNLASGAFTITFAVGGSGVTVPSGQSAIVTSDGFNMRYADTALVNAAQAASETFATNAANTAQANAETYAAAQAAAAEAASIAFATSAANTAQSNAETYAAAQASAAQAAAISTSETYTNAHALTLFRAGTFTCTNGTVTVDFSTPFPPGTTVIVNVTPYFASPDVGNIAPTSIGPSGFEYTNGNSGLCTYQATIEN